MNDQDNEKAATHLSRLGVNPVVTQDLTRLAEEDGMTLREFVRYVLADYVRHAPQEDASQDALHTAYEIHESRP